MRRDAKGAPRKYVKFFSPVAWRGTKKDRSICSACCLTTRRSLPNRLDLSDPVTAPSAEQQISLDSGKPSAYFRERR